MATTYEDVWVLMHAIAASQQETERRFQETDRKFQEAAQLWKEQFIDLSFPRSSVGM